MLHIDIQKTWYNKTIVQPDGVTHSVDTDTQYPMYLVQLANWYKDINSRDELIDAVVSDLKEAIKSLEQSKGKEEKGFDREDD